MSRVAAALGAALLVSCSGTETADRPGEIVQRDSAGVAVTTYPAGGFGDTLSPVPVLTIGREGDPNHEFFRLATVIPLASGNVVVANAGTYELRFFDPEGGYLRSVGGNGGGPAEFGFLSTAWLRPGDTLAVLDPNRRRLVLFDSAGTFVRGESYAGDLPSESPQASGPCIFPGLMGLLENGARVVRGWGCMAFQGSDGRRPITQTIEIVGSEGRNSLGDFSIAWVWERASPADPRDSYSLIPFGSPMAAALGRDEIYLSEGTDHEIAVHDAEGRLIRVLREDTVPPTVTEADRDAYLAERASAGVDHPADVPFPERFGSYSKLVVSFESDLWARRVSRPGDEVQHWVVFPADGSEIRRLVVPDIEVEAVRDGRIYGHRSDSLGIQTVLVFDTGG